ncbi:U2 snRNP-associated SURP motif-containing protein-like [Varroa jacobsoni]|uniref:U2 snRNP-associated SURP motif-containing protein n=1 Tax=Varroa destructor TaxID=109461 RepID=A0A7M7KSS5_VARDE|nr:U2 snRNP-associated SURP motif-containing protein-like [Varroa destructor]XP_022710034.1 U2 snRNP-associated SURP motif-containing protein-like [Varroa jacobsoni]
MSGGRFQVKSFSLGMGTTNKRLQQQKAEKARQEEESKAAAAAYEEFVATFDDKNKPKAFVKAGVVAPGAGERDTKRELYKPPRFEELEQRTKATPTLPPTPSENKPAKPGRKKDEPKKKSNLEMFKEELKIIQEEREERHRLKGVIKGQLLDEPKESSHRSSRSSSSSLLSFENISTTSSSNNEPAVARKFPGSSHDSDDPNTTNLYMSSLDPGLTEKDLCDIFGIFGPLASVKIMWPRSDEDRKKNRNYGFVGFMSRKDAERALSVMQGKMVRGLEMRMSWSKAVVIPPVPYYIPPVMAHLTVPPPPSGLPFNCQPPPDKAIPAEQAQCLPDDSDELKELIQASIVRVVAPSDRQLLSLIHRMVEFVVREGPLFEALVMSKEFNNPIFRFLFDFQCPAHIYYRWRLFSILQGDHPTKYRLKKFRMFQAGSWWKPPVQNPWTRGMPEHLFKKMESERRKDAKSEGDPATGKLEARQRAKLEHMVRILTPEKKRIGEVMLYCIEHAFAGEEIVDLIMDSLELTETPLFKKIARLYLVSDLVYNSNVRMPNASFYRPAFEPLVPRIIKALNATYESIEDKETADQFKQRVLNVLKAWQEWSLYPNDFLLQMQNTFMGFDKKPLVDVDPDEDQDTSSEKDEKEKNEESETTHTELSKPEQQKIGLAGLVGYGSDDSDQEMPTPKESEPPQPSQSAKPKFVASKWETVDPKVVEEQAVTTSKWDMFEDDKDKEKDKEHQNRTGGRGALSAIAHDPDEDSDSETSQSVAEQDDSERRGKLRDIECEVLKLQDELEKKRRYTRTEIQEQCREFRAKLVRRLDDADDKTTKRDKERRGTEKSDRDKDKDNSNSRDKNNSNTSGGSSSSKRYDSDEEQRDRKRDRSKVDKRRRSPSPVTSSRRRSSSSPRRRSPSPYRKRNKY